MVSGTHALLKWVVLAAALKGPMTYAFTQEKIPLLLLLLLLLLLRPPPQPALRPKI